MTWGRGIRRATALWGAMAMTVGVIWAASQVAATAQTPPPPPPSTPDGPGRIAQQATTTTRPGDFQAPTTTTTRPRIGGSTPTTRPGDLQAPTTTTTTRPRLGGSTTTPRPGDLETPPGSTATTTPGDLQTPPGSTATTTPGDLQIPPGSTTTSSSTTSSSTTSTTAPGSGIGSGLRLDRPSASPGDRAKVQGWGCGAGTPVTVTLAGTAAVRATSDADGAFTAQLDVPELDAGRYPVVARCPEPLRTDLDVVLATSVRPGAATLAVLVFFVLLILGVARGLRGGSRRVDEELA